MDGPHSEPSIPINSKIEPAPSGCIDKRSIAILDECLQALSKLPGLVVLKVVTPSQSNAMCKVYQTLLQHHWRFVGEGAMLVAAKDTLVRLLQQHPDMAEAFAEFLDEADIAAIVKGEGER